MKDVCFLLPSTENTNFHLVRPGHVHPHFGSCFCWADFSHRLWGLAHVCGGVGTGLWAIPWRLEDDLLEVLEAAIFMDSWTVQLAERSPQLSNEKPVVPGCFWGFVGGYTAQ